MKVIKPVSVSGTVISGDAVGRTIGFPTANLKLKKIPKIKTGVYVALVTLGKLKLTGLAYFGPRYIAGKQTNSFEVFIFDFNEAIYGQKMTVKLIGFLRSPKKITSLSSLKSLLQQDLKSLDGYVTIVNKKDQPVDIIPKKTAHLRSAKLHRAISVQLFDRKGNLLIQQRAASKMLFAGLWANTVCTDVRPYESYLQAANRRLKEEFGLISKLKLHHKFFYAAPDKKRGSEKELDHFFVGKLSGKPRPNPKEIGDFKLISLKDLKKNLKTNPDQYSHWFKLIVKRLSSTDILSI